MCDLSTPQNRHSPRDTALHPVLTELFQQPHWLWSQTAYVSRFAPLRSACPRFFAPFSPLVAPKRSLVRPITQTGDDSVRRAHRTWTPHREVSASGTCLVSAIDAQHSKTRILPIFLESGGFAHRKTVMSIGDFGVFTGRNVARRRIAGDARFVG